jgi:ER-bound oxygenase mpaB/B'/Rubber oxygenase, catalytic domain
MLELEELNVLRKSGDKPADDLMASLYDKFGSKFGSGLMPFLHDFEKSKVNQQDELIQIFFKTYSKLPSFYDKKDTIRASDFFSRHQQAIGVVLGCYSLPYCYLAEDGARVLGFSGRINSDTYNRLKETGNFLRKAMNYDHWESGQVITMLLKVRLLHAFWRFMVLKSNKWDMAWGLPINQEDLLGTNLSFSLIVLRGLKKSGFVIDLTYEKSYINHWATVGYIMGMNEKTIVHEMKDAIKIDKKIASRHFRASKIGKELTASLMNTYVEMSGSSLAGEFFKSQSRLMLGNEYADYLGIPESKFPPSILHAFNKTSSFLSNIYA